MDDSALDVAIIGAGLSGLALALALHQHSIPCSIYEARDAPLDVGGGLMLHPNGLKVLNKLGIYGALKKRGYSFDRIYFQDAASNRILETVEVGNVERYGIGAIRAYRFAVLEELLAAVKAKSIPIHFSRKFEKIVSETEDNVTWQFTDGSAETASVLIGADGIHSTVRSYLTPGLRPTFMSMAAIVAAVPTAQLELPEKNLADLNNPSNKHPLPGGIVSPGAGAIVIAPQTFSGDEVVITVQRPMSKDAGTSWTEINADKAHLTSLFRQNIERFPPIVQNAVRHIPHEKLFIWPFYQLPRLERWTSAKTQGGRGRVVILGDSAHALPPSAGQGVNQAFEDVYTFAGVLGRLLQRRGGKPTNAQLQQALFAWQTSRQMRIDFVLEMNRQMDLRRMPKKPGAPEQNEQEEKRLDLREMHGFLFNIDFEEAIDECMKDVD